MAWVWERVSGEIEELQENLEVFVEAAEHQVSLHESYARHGAFVDSKRTRIPPRSLHLRGKVTFESLEDAYEGLSRFAWLFSGGTGKFYPRADKSRYLKAVLTAYTPSHVGGLLWEVEAGFTSPEPFWLDAVEQRASLHVSSAALSVSQRVNVGGGWWVWPTITIQAVGGTVTNPKLSLADGRYVQYTGTLNAGDTLTLDPDQLTAKVGSTDVLDKVNLEWFDPTDRFYLNPLAVEVTFVASSIGSGGSCVATLAWRRRWL